MGKKTKDRGKKSKNKGPKGKKARAKAKLQRQWGEVEQSDESKPLVRQRGRKSRLLSSLSSQPTDTLSKPEQGHKEQHESIGKRNLKSDDSNNTDNEEEEEEEQEQEQEYNGVALFLEQLKKSTTKNNIDDEMDQDEESQSEASDNDKDDLEDDDDEDEMQESTVIDLFSERFSRPPLPETEQALIREMQRIQEEEQVTLDCLKGLELQISKQWMKQRNLLSLDHDQNQQQQQQWKRQGRAAFACNRDFLKQAWSNTRIDKNKTNKIFDDSFQMVMYPMLSSYMDVLYTAQKRGSNQRSMNRAISLHILNHVWTSRSRIRKHNKRIKEMEEQEQLLLQEKDPNSQKSKTSSSSNSTMTSDAQYRDQGFTRPTVLVLLPTRGVCFEFVRGIQNLLSGSGDGNGNGSTEASIANWERFEQEFGTPPQPQEDEIDTTTNSNSNNNNKNKNSSKIQRRRQVLQQKGPEWLELFGDNVNDDDDFKLGLQINIQAPKLRKDQATAARSETLAFCGDETTSCALKLFSDFYKSDIILASPLGLKMACIAKKGGDDDNERSHENDNDMEADFLSSIEICALLRSEVMLMQNWDHVNDILKLVNHQPKRTDHTDFSRVRHYLLAGQACHWRQLIVCSEFTDAFVLSTFKRFAKSISGVVRIHRRTNQTKAGITKVLVNNIRQVFQRIPCRSLADQGKCKLDYFAQHVLPDIQKRKTKHCMVFIPSYFDYVAVRNLLLKREMDFVSVTEYARPSEVTRGRARFLQGHKPILLYTGRAHFFLRHVIRGVRHLIFYGLPEQVRFYVDHVNRIGEGLDSRDDDDDDDDYKQSCLALFTKYDSWALERIVGHDNCKKMTNNEKETFFFDLSS